MRAVEDKAPEKGSAAVRPDDITTGAEIDAALEDLLAVPEITVLGIAGIAVVRRYRPAL